MSEFSQNSNDPLAFVRNLWGGMGLSMPGMTVPTFDVDELDKRIKDMKAVEGWLRMNLSMLQMTIQGLEMQRTTLGAVQAMGQMAKDSARAMASPEPAAAPEPEANPALSEAAMWPWQMMQQMRERMQETAEAAAQAVTPEAKKKPAARRSSAARK
ncbi:MAG: hypothetical protein FIB06_03170 [Betaproteobacteria bacterium]|nr:hypothetical protein [Betaproteobacteria bacterium]